MFDTDLRFASFSVASSMPHATLRVTFPEGVWIGSISRAFPDTQFRVLAAIPSEAVGVALVELRGPNPTAVADSMTAIDAVVDLEILESQPRYCLVQFETNLPLLLDAARKSGVPVSLPFTIQEGSARWEVTASRDRLSELGSSLDGLGLSFSIESIYQDVDSENLLTRQQWELISTALELGYYDTPRGCTQYELAEALDMARSTCSETLHRAEGRIISQFVEEARSRHHGESN